MTLRQLWLSWVRMNGDKSRCKNPPSWFGFECRKRFVWIFYDMKDEVFDQSKSNITPRGNYRRSGYYKFNAQYQDLLDIKRPEYKKGE